MGSLNFNIRLKIEHDVAYNLLREYENSDLYKETFYYGILVDWLKSDYIAEITSNIDSFLPANTLIYYFLCSQSIQECSLIINTQGEDHLFDFETKSEFICFMYKVWENRIDDIYHRYGTIILNPKTHIRTRNKLFKKYYKRLNKS